MALLKKKNLMYRVMNVEVRSVPKVLQALIVLEDVTETEKLKIQIMLQ